MNEHELETTFEEMGDALEDTARGIDRMRAIQKRLFRAVQELNRKHNAISDRVQTIEDTMAKDRLESTAQ